MYVKSLQETIAPSRAKEIGGRETIPPSLMRATPHTPLIFTDGCTVIMYFWCVPYLFSAAMAKWRNQTKKNEDLLA